MSQRSGQCPKCNETPPQPVQQQLVEALTFARVYVEKWCHYQGNTKDLFDAYLGPINAALSSAKATDVPSLEEIQAVLERLRTCSRAIVGAQMDDPDAGEAFEMYFAASADAITIKDRIAKATGGAGNG